MQKFVFLALAIFFLSQNSFAQTVHGVFKVVKGDVQVFSKNGSTTKAKIGQKVFPTDRIKAGKDSRAKVVMVDKNELNISPDSEIIIESYQYKPEENKKNVLINVLYGKVRAKVEQKYDSEQNKFQIKTPTAVAGVRGTDFITGFNRSARTTQVVTFHGSVAFGPPGPNGTIMNPVFVNVGQTTTMNGSAAPPPPVDMPKAELQQMDGSTDAAKTPEPTAQNQPAAGEGKKEPAKSDEGAKAEGEKSGGAKADGAKADGAKADGTAKGPAAGGAASGNGSGGTASNGNGPNTGATGSAPRQPASIAGPGAMPGGSMLRPEDMPSAGVVAPPLPSFQAPPPMPNMNLPTNQPALNDLIQTQNRRLNITIINNN